MTSEALAGTSTGKEGGESNRLGGLCQKHSMRIRVHVLERKPRPPPTPPPKIVTIDDTSPSDTGAAHLDRVRGKRGKGAAAEKYGGGGAWEGDAAGDGEGLPVSDLVKEWPSAWGSDGLPGSSPPLLVDLPSGPSIDYLVHYGQQSLPSPRVVAWKKGGSGVEGEDWEESGASLGGASAFLVLAGLAAALAALPGP